jgi:hypothetical protein
MRVSLTSSADPVPFHAGTRPRVLIAGSRTWTDAAAIAALLATLPPDTVIVHGAARGADTLAAHLAAARGFTVEAHPADWAREGRAAGPRRNAAMLATGVTAVWAFRAPGASPGTDDMMRQARAAGVPVVVCRPPAAPPPRVVNRRTAPFTVYIGRPSRWGNPFRWAPDTPAPWRVADRAAAVAAYRAWIVRQPALLAQLPVLRGQTLGCWCKPAACHGDVLAALAALPDPVIQRLAARALRCSAEPPSSVTP